MGPKPTAGGCTGKVLPGAVPDDRMFPLGDVHSELPPGNPASERDQALGMRRVFSHQALFGTPGRSAGVVERLPLVAQQRDERLAEVLQTFARPGSGQYVCYAVPEGGMTGYSHGQEYPAVYPSSLEYSYRGERQR